MKWVPVPGYEGFYEVSDQGQVRSLARVIQTVRGPWSIPAKLMTGCDDGHGHLFVTLSRNGEAKLWKIHNLMAHAFNLPRPEGTNQVRHLDDDKQNNVLENLAWGTESDNQKDSVRNGTHWNASKTHCKWNHPFSGENLGVRGGKYRYCKTCHREKMARRRISV